MLFNSIDFAIFLPIVFLLYWFVANKNFKTSKLVNRCCELHILRLVGLAKQFPKMKYIHTIRNGLDMAFSKNQNQLINWGNYYGVDQTKIPLPKASLEYWFNANSKAISQAKELLEDRFILIRFEELCLNPKKKIERIMRFLKVGINPELEKLVKVQPTTGRYKKNDMSVYDEIDFEKVKQFGYNF